MFVAALQMGLTRADMATMPFARLAIAMDEWADMNGSGGGAREATQADIVEMLY